VAKFMSMIYQERPLVVTSNQVHCQMNCKGSCPNASLCTEKGNDPAYTLMDE
jgi:hypothetical protein